MATFSVVLPSLIIILIFAAIYSKISKNRFLRGAFDGIKPVVTGLISAAGVSIALQVILPLMNLKDFSSADSWFDKFDWVSLILVAAAFGASRIKIKNKKLNPVILIVGGGVVGYLVFGLLIPAVAPDTLRRVRNKGDFVYAKNKQRQTCHAIRDGGRCTILPSEAEFTELLRRGSPWRIPPSARFATTSPWGQRVRLGRRPHRAGRFHAERRQRRERRVQFFSPA